MLLQIQMIVQKCPIAGVIPAHIPANTMLIPANSRPKINN